MPKLAKSTFIGFIACAAACLLLTITASAQNTSPLVRVGKTATPPVIDGNLNDAAWKNSIAVSDFSIIGTKTPAAETTQARFIYDNQNLYVAWRVQESLLVIARQEMHRVKTAAKKLDDNVLSDDSVVLFLQPGANAKMREFDINSIGTLFDAQSSKNDLWGTRDASWNSGAKVAAAQEDGFWTAEMAIPWKAFGIFLPKTGTSWKLGLARNAAGRGEISSWNPIGTTGIHSMRDFGALIFDDEVPAISVLNLPQFEAGKSTFAVDSSAPISVNATVTSDGKAKQFDVAGTSNITLPIAADAPKVLFNWDAKDGQKYFYRSPQLELSAESSLAHLNINTEKAWKLFVNGSQISAGNSAANQDIPIPLADGINDLVVEAQSGQAKLRLTPLLFAPQENIVWKMHAADDAKVLLEKNRAAWKIAPSINGEIGKTGAPTYFQHTLLYKSTLSYPVTSPAFYIAQNTAQQITFLAEGIKNIPLNNWQMTVAVPEEYEVLGSSGFYGNTIKGKTKFETTKIGATEINGQKMTLYRVAATTPITFGKYTQTVLNRFEILVRLSKNIPLEMKKEQHFYYWASANQGAISEAPQAIAVRALPPLNGKQPKKFVWELWTSQARIPQYDNTEMLPAILQTAKDAGVNTYLSSLDKSFNEEIKTYGMHPFSLIYFSDSRLTNVVKKYLKEHPEDALIDKNGKASDIYMDTTAVLNENWPMYEKWITNIAQSSGLDSLDYDYEYPPFNPPHASFAPRSLEEFRKFANIDAGVELNPTIIEKNYKNQWIDFMAYRTALLLKKMKDAVHEANPKVLFTSYSGYYDAKDNTTKTRYGIDWNLVGEMQAVDEAGMGYGRPVDGITDSIAALRGIPVKFGELLAPYDEHARQPVAPFLKANLLRRALDATAGVLLFTRHSMDGRSWQAVAEITRLTADYEDVFLHKTLQNVPDQDSASVQIAKGGGKVLLCVMNFSRVKESTFTITIPSDLGAGTEYYSGQKVRGGQTVNITLAPGDVRVFIF